MNKVESRENKYLCSFNATATAVVASAPVLPPGEEIYDLMPPQALSYPWLQIAAQALTVTLTFWLLWLLYRWLTAPVARPVRNIVQSPQKLAFRAVERLKLSPVWHEKQAKEICETLAAILKIYAHDGYQIGIGASSTSDELINCLGRVATTQDVMKNICELLGACDRIKFTGIVDPAFAPEELAGKLVWLLKHAGWLK